MATNKKALPEQVNILGTTYEIVLVDSDKHKFAKNLDVNDANGLCEPYTKQIIIDARPPKEGEEGKYLLNLKAFRSEVLRHEIFHACSYESGLQGSIDRDTEERMAAWFATMLPKLFRTCNEMHIR